MRIEQAAWVKPGVRVRWKGSPFGIGGVIVPLLVGSHVEVGVQYDGSAVVWEGDVASSWEPAAGAELTPSFMLDGGPCAKPESRGDVCGDHVGRVRSEACYVCKAGPMQACGNTAAPAAASFAARVTEVILGEQAPRPVSTMEQVIARLDTIDATLKPLAHMALDAEGRVVAVPPISPMSASPNVPAHDERYKAAHEAMYVDLYAAPCPRCGAPRWGGCVAVDGEPTDVTPEEAVRVRVDRTDIGPVFRHISWASDPIEFVTRGFFEACAVSEVDAVGAPRRPGLQRVPRPWDTLTKAEQAYWFNVVRGYLDGSSDPGLSPVEEVVLGAMARVFRLERAGRL